MPAARQQARTEARPAWQKVLATNQAAYRTLLAQARKAERGEVPCTICDGLSYTPCVMCSHHDGKCIACRGAGQRVRDVLCPTCLGSGKCYLCTGAGKMFCPFCDDGMIQSHRAEPPDVPPLH
jgi:DnaJ-class molecular chaperone